VEAGERTGRAQRHCAVFSGLVGQYGRRSRAPDSRRVDMTAETGPIRVFPRDGKWLVDYGSYAHGYHATRREAIETATRAARAEQRGLKVEAS
jgi:hypothetical protein